MIYGRNELSDMFIFLTKFFQYYIVQPKSDQYLTETAAATDKTLHCFMRKDELALYAC